MIMRPTRLNRVRPPQALRRGAALYVAVTGTTMIVSVLALSSMAIVRIERQQATAVNSRLLARSHARSAVELALRKMASDPGWRDDVNGAETTPQSLGSDSPGTASWIVSDLDGSLTNADRELWLRGIGRVGDTVQVSSVRLSTGEVPDELRSYTNSSGSSEVDLEQQKWWGQYFKPVLNDPNANGWRITRARIRIERRSWNQLFRVCLYRAGANRLPNGVAIESVPVNSSDVDDQMHTVTFAGSTWLDAGEGVCLTLETDGGTPIRISHVGDSVSTTDSELFEGDPAWKSHVEDKSLQYRIDGFYTTSSDEVRAVSGSWVWDAAP